MTTIGSQSQSTRSTLFPVEWPLTQTTAGSMRQPTVCRATTPQIKRRKKEHRNIVEQNKPCPQETTTTTDQQIADTPNCRELSTEVNHNSQRTSISDVKYEPTSPPAVPNIFKSLDHDEACWLVKEVNEANKSIFGAERTAEKLKQDDRELDKKKASLCALKSLLGDLRRNIKYPDEETAKDLDTLDEVSANFGVRNMVNCLGLLDSYFSELQKQLDK